MNSCRHQPWGMSARALREAAASKEEGVINAFQVEADIPNCRKLCCARSHFEMVIAANV